MIDNNEIYENQLLILLNKIRTKIYLFILLAIVDIIGCVYYVLETKEYLGIILFVLILAYLLYDIITNYLTLKNENYVILKLVCKGSEASHIGYSIANSLIYNFEIENINNQAFKYFFRRFSEENAVAYPEQKNGEVALQQAHDWKLKDVTANNREQAKKFKEGDILYCLFRINKNKPLFFTNANLLSQNLYKTYIDEDDEKEKDKDSEA